MNQFFDFLIRMGGLHDSEVKSLCWLPIERTLRFSIDDLYSNFEGLPQYPGHASGEITLINVSELKTSLEADARLRIFEFLPKEGATDTVVVTFSPAGRIEARFESAQFPAIEVPRE